MGTTPRECAMNERHEELVRRLLEDDLDEQGARELAAAWPSTDAEKPSRPRACAAP